LNGGDGPEFLSHCRRGDGSSGWELARSAREARRFLSGGHRSYLDIRVRLDELIADGRRELADSRVSPDEIEAWDTSFRAMFLLCAWRPF
jgi:hypothetical protein